MKMTMQRCFAAALLFLFFAAPAYADALPDVTTTYLRGHVESVLNESVDTVDGLSEGTQTLLVKVRGGVDDGKVLTMSYGVPGENFARQKLREGDDVVLALATSTDGSATYSVVDKMRLPNVLLLTLIFVVLSIAFGGIRGLTSLVGLAASLGVLLVFVVPRILAGNDPAIISIIGAAMIAVVSIYLAHGFNRRSSVALVATLATLVFAVVAAYVAVALVGMSGAGSEQAIYLQIGVLSHIDLRGLLLGGMIIGALGVLDDVTTAQVASIDELAKADPSRNFRELYKSGISIGREHIAALVNTLALAYAGASFPLLLLFAIPGGPPLWVVTNGEYIVEEVVRTLVGGITLVLAVPVATLLAAYVYRSKR